MMGVNCKCVEELKARALDVREDGGAGRAGHRDRPREVRIGRRGTVVEGGGARNPKGAQGREARVAKVSGEGLRIETEPNIAVVAHGFVVVGSVVKNDEPTPWCQQRAK